MIYPYSTLINGKAQGIDMNKREILTKVNNGQLDIEQAKLLLDELKVRNKDGKAPSQSSNKVWSLEPFSEYQENNVFEHQVTPYIVTDADNLSEFDGNRKYVGDVAKWLAEALPQHIDELAHHKHEHLHLILLCRAEELTQLSRFLFSLAS
jgi:hypothetical protein